MKRSLGARALIYPAPVLVVGSYDDAGRPNAMTVAWGGICCSNPPSVAVAIRPTRLTHHNLLARRAFTVNIPSEAHAVEADYFGIVSGRDEDKFSVAGLTPVPSDLVDAPYVGEFPLVLECRLSHTLDLGIHTLFIGKIVDIKADEAVLAEDGLPDMEALRPIVYAPGSMTYHGVGGALGPAYSMGKALMDRPSQDPDQD